MKIHFSLLLIFILLIGSLIAACNSNDTKVHLPEDDSPHFDSPIEWWYYNGHLNTGQGDNYAFHYAVFQVSSQGLPVADVAHFSISSPEGNYLFDQKMVLGTVKSRNSAGFSFNIGGWTLSGNQGHDTLNISARDYSLNLTFEQEKPPVLHQGTGLVSIGEKAKSYYYSRTRMNVTGTLSEVGGIEVPVTGLGWFDHQWGDFNPLNHAWDWFGLQLSDGPDIMLSVVRNRSNQTVYRYGSFVDSVGTASYITSNEIEISSPDNWTSPASGAVYPSGWTIKIPDKGIDITVTPVIKECEFNAKSTTHNYYWEGEVMVSGSHNGRGFVELTGYKE